MGVCAGEAIEVESMEVEALGRVSSGVGCGGMCRRGYRSHGDHRGLGNIGLGRLLWGIRGCVRGGVVRGEYQRAAGEKFLDTCRRSYNSGLLNEIT